MSYPFQKDKYRIYDMTFAGDIEHIAPNLLSMVQVAWNRQHDTDTEIARLSQVHLCEDLMKIRIERKDAA